MSDKLPFRHPDRPITTFSLSMVREGEFLSQTKYDGHMIVISKDNGTITTLSRHNKPLPVSKSMMAELAEISMQDGMVLHGEWTGRREANPNEGIYLFSMVYQNYEWLGNFSEEERWKRLAILKPTNNIHIVWSRFGDYASHYKETIDDLKTEGIVLKRRTAKLIGGFDKPRDNPGFLKAKWRLASDGMSRHVIPDDKLICME